LTEPDRADEFRDAVAKIPSRSFRPSKRKGAVGLGTILLVVLAVLRFGLAESRSHHVDDTAYLQCIAQAQSGSDATGLGDPGTIGQPGGTGQQLNEAVIACSKYPH
jgi:hypothetical protein